MNSPFGIIVQLFDLLELDKYHLKKFYYLSERVFTEAKVIDIDTSKHLIDVLNAEKKTIWESIGL